MFDDLPKKHFGAILADPPWHFDAWSKFKDLPNGSKSRAVERYYSTMSTRRICALPVDECAAKDCALFLWVTWPHMEEALAVIAAWGFTFKTAAFVWTKAHAGQIEMFEQSMRDQMGMGSWTRANTEPCLLATRGRPKRINADVRQAIIEPRRQHSRKPDCVHERIERLVAGPYLELFARQQRPGWTVWGNETDKFKPATDWDSMWSKPFDNPELFSGPK